MGKRVSNAKKASKKRLKKTVVAFLENRGRPNEFKPEYVDMAKRAALLATTNEKLAKFFDIGMATFVRWMAEHEDFRIAVKQGREYADAHVAESLYHRATGYSHPAVKILMQKTRIVEGEGDSKVVTEEHEPLLVPFTEHYPPDTEAAKFWLKNRHPDTWRDKFDTGGAPVVFDQSTNFNVTNLAANLPEDVEKTYNAAMKDITALVMVKLGK